MVFTDGEINDVSIHPLKIFSDQRGWLTELFRKDELPQGFQPLMGYLSVTHAGSTRGPHEHQIQTDFFCFFGKFDLYLWDNRDESATYGNRMTIEDTEKKIIIIPPGIVHAYKNTGTSEAFVLNFPDKLYAGCGRKEKVDEIRYESDPDSPFQIADQYQE
jgi:dTDP-4-dehydrorhamnose 3,5-epimerase